LETKTKLKKERRKNLELRHDTVKTQTTTANLDCSRLTHKWRDGWRHPRVGHDFIFADPTQSNPIQSNQSNPIWMFTSNLIQSINIWY